MNIKGYKQLSRKIQKEYMFSILLEDPGHFLEWSCSPDLGRIWSSLLHAQYIERERKRLFGIWLEHNIHYHPMDSGQDF